MARVSRRTVLASAATLAAGAFVGHGFSDKGRRGRDGANEVEVTGDGPRTPIPFEPFQAELPLPRFAQPVAPFDFEGEYDPAWGTPTFYNIEMKNGVTSIIPGIETEICGYDGLYPGPTIPARYGTPTVVRFVNKTGDRLTSIHQHGGHTPAANDGHPGILILPEVINPRVRAILEEELPFPTHSLFKDYVYPNIVPLHNGEPDLTEAPSTMWYHDHALDVTAENVYSGMAGFFLFRGPIEDELVARNVLPTGDYDIPLVIQDRVLNADGSLLFDQLNHDGFLGDLFVVNGKVQPTLVVEPRKYRFRLLNGCTARHLELEATNGSFLRIGNDSWLLPQAIPQDSALLAPATRADIIIDFSHAPQEVFLENILVQTDGRGPEGKREAREVVRPGVPVLRFLVLKPDSGLPEATIQAGTELQPHTPILDSEIVRTRRFTFSRKRGSWVVNDRLFDPMRSDTPGLKVGTAERWILRNPGGGWWHPIHIHLESHQLQSIDGRAPMAHEAYKGDTVILGGGTEAVLYMKFRTFEGPFVFHCHNLHHEDMRMMANMNPTFDGGLGRLTRSTRV